MMRRVFTMLLVLSSILFGELSFALPFNITPLTGLPVGVSEASSVFAYYTVRNMTSSQRNNNFVKYLPPSVSQVTTGGTYANTCGSTFNLAPNATCTLQLLITGAINASDPTVNNHLFVCFPGGVACAGTTVPLNVSQLLWKPLEVAYEIVNTSNVLTDPTAFMPTYKNGGSNSITGTEWETYTPPEGYTKNTTRNLQFNEQIFLGSPGDPMGVTSYLTTSDGYTWGALSLTINAMWPYDPSQYTGAAATSPFLAGNLVTTPPPGVVKVTANYKAQQMKFYANNNNVPVGTPGAVPIARYFITDEWGNRYIMHASDYDNPTQVAAAFAAAVLPAGWTKQTEYLSSDFILTPAYGLNNNYEYNLIRDSADNTYHQMYWGSSGITVTSKVQATGMPIWGGTADGLIKISNSFNNSIYGGGGANTFFFVKTLTAGVNTIGDFNAGLGDRLNFDGQTYTTQNTASGVQLNLSGGAKVVLSNVFTFSSAWVVG